MKRYTLFFILCALLLFQGSAEGEGAGRRGLFVTMLQEPLALSSRAQISNLVDFAKSKHINVLFVQVYQSNRALFPSKLADSKPYENCLKNVSKDPLRLLIKEAHAAKIEVYAWLNMLSLGTNNNAILLKKYGNNILTRNLKKKKTLEDYKIDEQYFLEPGDTRVREYLTGIVGEVVGTYKGLDGILFDYIRYPDQKPAYGHTEMNTSRFKKATGLKTIKENSKAWRKWKRDQVTEVLELLVKKTRKLRPNIMISATGCMPYSRAYLEAFQDWPSWLKRGLVDSVTIMSYSPSPAEFEEWIATAGKKVWDFKKINVGLGAYKLTGAPAAFEKELHICKRSGGGAYVIFDYESLLKNHALGSILKR